MEDAHQELLNISEWMRVNKLSPYPKKTEFMVIGHPFKARSLYLPEVRMLDGSNIKRVDQAKSLGITIDEKLTWDEHLRRVKGKMSAGLSALKQLKNMLPQSQLCRIPEEIRNPPTYIRELQNKTPEINIAPPTLDEIKQAIKILKPRKSSLDIKAEILQVAFGNDKRFQIIFA